MIGRDFFVCVVVVVDGWPIRTGNGEKPLLLVDGIRGGRKRRRKVSAMEVDVEMVSGSVDEVVNVERPAGRMNVNDEERGVRRDDVDEGGCELCRDGRTGLHSWLKDQPELNMPWVGDKRYVETNARVSTRKLNCRTLLFDS